MPAGVLSQEVDEPVRYDEDYLSADFHRSRRDAVMEQLPGNSLVVLFGAPVILSAAAPRQIDEVEELMRTIS